MRSILRFGLCVNVPNVEFELATKLKSLGEKHPEVSTLKAKREFIDRVLRELAQPNPRLLNLFESSQKKP